MNDTIFKELPTQNVTIHTILHIGAGEHQNIGFQFAVTPKRLILVEPNPELAGRLREKSRLFSHVEIYELAVTASAKEEQFVQLHEYNWNSASSLQEADQLEQLFPGLQLVRIHQVKALSPTTLIDRLGLEEKEEHALIIEAPAAERGIIESLCDSGKIGLFSTIVMSCPGPSLYVEGGGTEGLLDRLSEYGFEEAEQIETDPDWPVFLLKRNRWHYEQMLMVKRLSVFENKVNSLKEDNRKLSLALSDRERDMEIMAKKLADCEAELIQAVLKHDEQTELVSQQQALIDQIKSEQEEQARIRLALEEKNEKVSRARDEHASLARESQRRVSELESQLADLEHREALTVEEMNRAEGQLELIKEVMLKDLRR